MLLKELNRIATTALPIADFKEHLRLGTGFSDDDVQDNLLDMYLRAAIAAIEGRIHKALIVRYYLYTAHAWKDLNSVTLPVGPFHSIRYFQVFDVTGKRINYPTSQFRTELDFHSPKILPKGISWPQIPVGGYARIYFYAGISRSWNELPADLAQAVFLLAAHYYENRYENAASNTSIPSHINVLLEKYKKIRLFGGRG